MKNGIGIAGRAAVVAALWAVTGALAADVTWDGNGNSDNDGNWNVNDNWDTGSVPTTADRAILPSVSSGTRTITQDIVGGTTANALRFVQDNDAGISKLSLSGNLTLSQGSREAATMSSTTSAFQVSLSGGATQDQVIVDLNGNRLYFATSPGSSNSGGNLAGIINFNVDNSRVHAVAGHSRFNVFGTLNVTANGEIGRIATSQANGALNFLDGSVLNISNSATLVSIAAGAIQSGRNHTLTNQGTLNIGAGSSLAHRMTSEANGQLRVQNSTGGQVVQAGTLELRGGDSVTSFVSVTNSAEWIVSGESARILRNSFGTNSQMPSFTNDSAGLFRGAGASDILDYDRSGTVATDPLLTITNNGTIAPGAGSQGSGLASIGNLILRDINVTMGSHANATVAMDIGGTTSGQFDTLKLEQGLTDPIGAGSLMLDGNGTLQLWKVNGFAPAGNFSITLINAGSVSGEFGTVKLDGDSFVANELDVGGGMKYVLGYTADSVTLSYIPEPATAGLIGGSLVLLALRRRRARA